MNIKEKMIKQDLKNCRIYDNDEITIKMIKMGLNIDDERNYRVCGIIPAENGDYICVELSLAHRFDKNYFPDKKQREKYFDMHKYSEYIVMDFCFRVDDPKEHLNNRSPKYEEYLNKSYANYEYTNQNIVKVLQEFNPNITNIELVDDYYIDDYIEENNFYKLYDSRLEHKYEPLEIIDMNDYYIKLKTKYSCLNYNQTILYEEERVDEYKTSDLDDLKTKYGKDKLENLIEEYNKNKKNLFDLTM